LDFRRIRHRRRVRDIFSFTDVYKDVTLKDLLRDDNFGVVVHHLSREGTQSLFFHLDIHNLTFGRCIFTCSLCHEGRVIVAGTVVTMTDVHSEVQKSSFSVTGFNLTEYRKKKPDVYRYVFNSFCLFGIKFYLYRIFQISQAGDDVLQFLEEKLITPSCSLIVGLHKINDALRFLAESKSSGKVSGR